MKDMTLNEYQLLAARTINPALTEDEVEQHALFGLASEVGEEEHLLKELGDVAWMLAELCTVDGYTLGEDCRMNIDKLRARYPDGFDTDHSIHRRDGDI